MQEVEIRLKGQIDPGWSSWLGTLSVAHLPGGETILTGPVRDQSALYGLIERLSSLGFELLQVNVKPPMKKEGGGSM
jgi:hypothetical protein